MWARAAIWALLFALSFLFTRVTGGPSPISFALFPIPVAIAIVRRHFYYVHALFACAAISGAAGVAAAVDALGERSNVMLIALTATFYVFVAFVGVPLGWGILSRWSYGRIVAMVTTMVFAVVLPVNIAGWHTINEECIVVLDQFEARLDGETEALPAEALEKQRDAIEWLRRHNVDMFFGLVGFGTVLVAACVALSGTSAGLRIGFGEPGPTGSFAEMRPPDWLVWAVIAAAVGYFVEQRWPDDWVRAIVWNAAFGLGVVYWLNGLSVMAYASNALHPNLVVFALVVMMIWITGFVPIPCVIGLFDTWADFRQRAAAVAKARSNPPER